VTARGKLPALPLAVAALAACGPGEPELTIDELMRPESCMDCHPKHYREWSGSMHAYAAEDPVFVAMNARGQADTDRALGDFCVQCHAPMAVRLGLTTNGLNLADVPAYAKGVTCYFCHSVDAVEGEHNNPLVLASDGVMRGGLRDPGPAHSPAHRSAYSELVDADNPASSAMCGACHDIVTPAGVHLERTFAEWKTTIFGQVDRPQRHLSCGECHMLAADGLVADREDLDVPFRPYGVREHTFPGIDVALTPFPEKDAQRAAIARDLKGSILPRQLCFEPDGVITYEIENVGSGHMWPSGAAQDRRAWAEVIAYDAAGGVVFSSGVVPDGVDPDGTDPNLFRFWDDTFDANDQPAHFFWEVARHDAATLLPPTTTLCPQDPGYFHAVAKEYAPINPAGVARVTARVLIRPLPYELMNLLAIDPAIQVELPTHAVEGTQLEWTPTTHVDYCVKPAGVPPPTPQCP
jgi:hypothetical protein